MSKNGVLWLMSIAILSIIATIVVLCIASLIGDAIITIITIFFLVFIWQTSSRK